jgi:hypothetical protein
MFVQTDAGRSKSLRPRQANDCTVRALALAVEVPYDVAYDELARRGRKSHRRTHFPNQARDDEAFGVQLRWIPFSAVKGQPRMTPEAFCRSEEFRYGTWILKMAKHVATVKDGALHDLEPNGGRCVYGVWEVCGTTANVAELGDVPNEDWRGHE